MNSEILCIFCKYDQKHETHSRSEVLKLLQERELEQQYNEASEEVDMAVDIAILDGL